MQSKLVRMLFTEPERWENLINRADMKGINKAELRQFSKPETRVALYRSLVENRLMFPPEHEAQIPKDTPGEFRTVYVGETTERILCPLINDCLFKLLPHMVSSSVKSYQKGLSCGKTVKGLSHELMKVNQNVVGIKTDYHHFFDDISREAVFHLFDKIERELGFEPGTEPVVNLMRRTWSDDLVFDIDGNLVEKWRGIRQGNAIAAFLADAIVNELDTYMVQKYPYYVRYSDDIVCITDKPDEAIADINRISSQYGVVLNPKKTELLTKDKWFKFLGFSIKGSEISLSCGRLKKFQKEIEKRTIKSRGISPEKAVNKVNQYLYKGDKDGHSWASQVLSTVNNIHDLNLMNEFVMDCLRAVQTRKTKLGGLGYVPTNKEGVVVRGIGKNVAANRAKTAKEIDGYYSLNDMRNVLLTRKGVYDTIVRMM